MDSSITAPVEAQLAAYNSRDIENFCPEFSDDVECYSLKTGELLIKGIADFRERYGKLFAASPKLHCKLVSRTVCNDFVIDEERVTGRAGNENVEAHVCAIYLVRDGKIARVWFTR